MVIGQMDIYMQKRKKEIGKISLNQLQKLT